MIESDQQGCDQYVALKYERQGAFMTNGLPAVPLGFTALVVADLDKVSSFYGAVCGLVEERRREDRIGGQMIREVEFRSNPTGTGTFVLIEFVGQPRPAGRAVILGFVADDIDQFVARAIAAGAAVVEAVHSRPELGLKAAFMNDVEGNLIEVVELA